MQPKEKTKPESFFVKFHNQMGVVELTIFFFVCVGLFFSFFSLYRQTEKLKNSISTLSHAQLPNHSVLRIPANDEGGLKITISCEKNPGFKFSSKNCKK